MIDLNSLGLVGYVVVTGLRSTVLKGLQIQGNANPIGGENPISFCNVFLISQLMVGLALILSEPRRTWSQMGTLSGVQRIQLVSDAFFGCFLAPMAFFLALDKLTVISQTLLFALTLPAWPGELHEPCGDSADGGAAVERAVPSSHPGQHGADSAGGELAVFQAETTDCLSEASVLQQQLWRGWLRRSLKLRRDPPVGHPPAAAGV